MYLMIQNSGVAPVESYTLLGASAARDSGVEGVIGQFGSGAKHATNVLLRADLDFKIYCGKTCIKFSTTDTQINDGLSVKTAKQVVAKLTGAANKTIKLGWTLGFGALDWADCAMALREFISNAIDRTLRGGEVLGEAVASGDLRVCLVDDNQVRALDGYTRVFIEATEEVVKYVEELPRRFLQFSQDPLKNSKMQPKSNRNFNINQRAMIYRNGVFVCELEGEHSLCDYNFSTSELRIDEARNLNSYTCRAAIAELYKKASSKDIARTLRAIITGVKCLEGGLDKYYMTNYGSASEEAKRNWAVAWEIVAGEGILCHDNKAAEALGRKGHSAVVVLNEAWLETAKHYGIKSIEDVMDIHERQGRSETEATDEAKEALATVWKWVESAGMDNYRHCPHIRGFNELTECESECLGYYKPGGDTIWIRNDQGGKQLLETVLEELCHYVTGATDCSRDFQNWLMRMIVRILT
jgi:hypothetical protein